MSLEAAKHPCAEQHLQLLTLPISASCNWMAVKPSTKKQEEEIEHIFMINTHILNTMCQ